MATQPYGSRGIRVLIGLAMAGGGCGQSEQRAGAPPPASSAPAPEASTPSPAPSAPPAEAARPAEAPRPSPPVAMAPAPDRGAAEVDDPSPRPPPSAFPQLKAERRSESAMANMESGRPLPAPKARPGRPESPADALAAVDRAMATLTDANVAFNTPRTMNLHNTAEIQLLLSIGEAAAALKDALTAPGEAETARVKVSSRMEARLTGANFQITAISPEEQAISRSGTTEWKWEVKPTRTGSHRLHLTLTALFDVERSGPVRRGIKTFDQTIDVEVTWGQQLASFFEGNWQWLWTALLVPVAGWAWKRRSK